MHTTILFISALAVANVATAQSSDAGESSDCLEPSFISCLHSGNPSGRLTSAITTPCGVTDYTCECSSIYYLYECYFSHCPYTLETGIKDATAYLSSNFAACLTQTLTGVLTGTATAGGPGSTATTTPTAKKTEAIDAATTIGTSTPTRAVSVGEAAIANAVPAGGLLAILAGIIANL